MKIIQNDFITNKSRIDLICKRIKMKNKYILSEILFWVISHQVESILWNLDVFDNFEDDLNL